MNSPDVTPLSPTALAIIAILVLVLHVASGDMLDRPHAHSSIVAPGGEADVPGRWDVGRTVAAIRLAGLTDAVFAGSMLGIPAFRSVNVAGFRRIILVLLLLSGASLALA